MILFRNFVFRQLFLLSYSSILGKTFLSVVGYFLSVLSKLTFTNNRNFWGGSSTGKFPFFSFFDLGRNLFWFLTFSVKHDCQNYMVSARKNTVNKKFSFSTELFWLSYSRNLGEMFLRFGRKNLAGLSKQPSTYPEKYFNPSLSSENNIHYLFFGFWANIFSTFS